MERSPRRIEVAASRADELVTFWESCREPLEQVIPHYLTPCWFTVDARRVQKLPATALTSQDGVGEAARRGCRCRECHPGPRDQHFDGLDSGAEIIRS
jgi:hypothetical protein